MKFAFFALFCLLLVPRAEANDRISADSIKKNSSFFENASAPNKDRQLFLKIIYPSVYTASMSWLYTIWYRKFPSAGFHFFNDYPEWLQMDKMGHITTSFNTGKYAMEIFRWSGMNQKKAALYGAGAGFFFLLSIETFDGFSKQWGFSLPDAGANTIGSFFLLSQQAGWKETRIQLKFSFHPENRFSDLNPTLLGSNLQEQLIKNYNRQTYWLSGNIYSFLREQSKFPKWLNLSAGYGARGMIGGRDNIIRKDNTLIADYSGIPRERLFYFSLDADLSKIKMKPGILNTLIHSVGFIKIPAPAIEFSQDKKILFHPLFF